MHSYLWSIYIVCMACQKTLFAFVSPIDIYHSGHSSYVFWDIYHRIVYSVGKAKYCFKISWTVSQLLIWIPHGGSSSAYLNTFPGSCTFSLLIFFFFSPANWPFPDSALADISTAKTEKSPTADSSSWANKKYFIDKNPIKGNVSCLQKAE